MLLYFEHQKSLNQNYLKYFLMLLLKIHIYVHNKIDHMQHFLYTLEAMGPLILKYPFLIEKINSFKNLI